MNKFYEFMRGRYGADELSAVIVLFSFLLLLIVSIVSVWWLSLLPLFLVSYAAFRILSKNIPQRKKENEYLLSIKDSIKNKSTEKKEKKATKTVKEEKTPTEDFIFIKCPACNARLRLKKGTGEISVSCPSCKKKLRVRS